MLAKVNRLTKREDFATIFAKGNYVFLSQGIAIKFLKTNSQAVRLGFPVGKNYSKKATARNRMRRVLRNATAKILSRIKPGCDIIVLIRPDYKLENFSKTLLDLEKIFSKANLLI